MARVLLAESDRRIREFIAGILSDCGHAVEACANGIEARASLASGVIDIVVTDLVLGLGHGAAFGRNCAALGVPMITLSGRELRPGQAMKDRPPSLFEKPFRFADLQRVLDAVALRSRSAPPSDHRTRDAA
jgi:two-component system, OmpR family, response regulator